MIEQQDYIAGNYENVIGKLKGTTNADELEVLAYSYQKTGKFEEAMEACRSHAGDAC